MLMANLFAQVGLITENKAAFLTRKRKAYEKELISRKPDPKKLAELRKIIGVHIGKNIEVL